MTKVIADAEKSYKTDYEIGKQIIKPEKPFGMLCLIEENHLVHRSIHQEIVELAAKTNTILGHDFYIDPEQEIKPYSSSLGSLEALHEKMCQTNALLGALSNAISSRM